MEIRNRKLPISDSSNAGELPIYNNHGSSSSNSSNSHNNGSTRHQRRVRSRKTTSLSSSLGVICVFLIVASLCIVGVQHLGSNNSNKSPRRFLVNAAAASNTMDNAPATALYDIAILGAGPAGLTAAIFGARAGLKVVVLGSQAGLLAETPRLENFPGYHDEHKLMIGTGEEWLKTTRNQAREVGANFALPGLVASSLQLEKQQQQQVFSIPTQVDTFQARSVIVATGATSRKLNLPHEQDLWGRHLHNCAICDGPMYKGKTVVVIGGGDAAIDAAIYLSRRSKKVILVHRKNSFDKVKAQSSLELVRQTSNIDIHTPHVVTAWNTEETENDLVLTGVTLQDQSSNNHQDTKYIACDGAFLMIGATPNTGWLFNTLLLDDYGLIRLDMHEEKEETTTGMVSATSLPGVFAAGEVIDAQYKQAITAAAEGAQAALDAERWLRSQQEQQPTISANHLSEQRQQQQQQQQLQEQDAEMKRQQQEEKEPAPENVADCEDLTKQDCIDQIVHKYRVVVFSKPWCPYCRKALEALAIEGVTNPHIIDLSEHENTYDIQATLASMTGGRRTVPNVFVGGTSIGGGDETVALQKRGRLKGLLAHAGAIKGKDESQERRRQTIGLGPPPNRDYGCDLGTEDCVTKIVNRYPLVLFSLSWCPECHRMLELLATVGIQNPHIIDLDDYKKDGTNYKIRESLVKKAKSNQVPSLFVGGEALGRHYNVLQLNQSGQLVPKLQAAGVI